MIDNPEQVLLTAAEAADRVHVPVRTVETWVRRGQLHATIHLRNGQPLYREIDVLEAEAVTRRTPRLRQLLDLARRLT